MKKGYARKEDGTICRTEYQVSEGRIYIKTGMPLYPTGNKVKLVGWEHPKVEEFSANADTSRGDYLLP